MVVGWGLLVGWVLVVRGVCDFAKEGKMDMDVCGSECVLLKEYSIQCPYRKPVSGPLMWSV